jgi:hypothetical protein
MQRMSDKRYVIQCVACGLLQEVSRSDAVCCSSGCRVRLKRHPELRERFTVKGLNDDIPLAFQLQLNAYTMLFPERVDAILAGTLDVEHPTRKDVIADDARHDACREFSRRVLELAAQVLRGELA